MSRRAFLDIEASGLDDDLTYPVEVAVVRDDGQARSWLITPTEEWLETGTWSDDSADVHGLSLDLLMSDGFPVETVAQDLAEFVSGGWTVLSDARLADGFWLRRLYVAAGRKVPFELSCFWAACQSILHGRRNIGWTGESGIPPHPLTEAAMDEARRQIPQEHRALPDAQRLAIALGRLDEADDAA